MKNEDHYVNRISWIRAAVLGANDGILSTASIAIGVAAASEFRSPIVLASVAGLVAGALSMSTAAYVSASSQADIEAADLKREQEQLESRPEEELKELAKIFEDRGLDKDVSLKVAEQLTERDVLMAHARNELGITEINKAKPLQAALAAGSSFVAGGLMPVIVSMTLPVDQMVILQYCFAIVFLILLGAFSSKSGGSSTVKSILRISFWGTVTMGLTAAVGYFFNSMS